MDTQTPQSPHPEPNSKRLKLTTTTTTTTTSNAAATATGTGTTTAVTATGTTTSSAVAATDTTTSSSVITATNYYPTSATSRRRKIAIFFAYCGFGYQGMQKNPGAKTIEGDLEEALYQSGAVPLPDRGHPRKYDWARSARTDKGVSAVGQVASGRFFVDPDFVNRLNSKLVDQIRVFGFKRVTGAFNAQKFCDRRRYVYLVPVFALDPSSHCSGIDELCFECSKRGRKVGSTESGVLSNNVCVSSVGNGVGTESANLSSNVCISSSETGVSTESGSLLNNVCVSSSETGVGDRVGERKDGECRDDEGEVSGLVEVKKSEFCYGEKEKERLNRVLRYYVGTHNFHNFTSRITAQDPSAKRYIVSFNANETVSVDGIEFVKCEVVGQSFLLHQIRKMIGLAVVIMRDTAPETLIERAFRKDVKINVPVAPEVGLYLDECFFSPYNKKWKDSHEEVSMKAYMAEAEDFKMKYIYPHIASTEHKDGTVALWLHYLNHRNYPDLRIGASTSEEKFEPRDSLARSNDDAIRIEVENARSGVNGSSGDNSNAENIVVKDIHAGGDGNTDFQNVEVKDMDQ